MLRRFAALFAGLTLLSACGGAPSAPRPAAAPSASAPAAAPSQAKQTVNIIVPAASLSFSPIYAAINQGDFAKEGLDAKLIALAGGNETVNALRSGGAQLAITNAGNLIEAYARGATDIIGVGTQLHLDAMEVGISKAVADKAHLTPSMPLKERIQLLKGLKIAIDTPGALADQTLRYAARYAGMDPSKDFTLVPVGGVPTQAAALENGQVDALTYTPPTLEMVEKTGKGVRLFEAAELPGMDQMAHSIFIASQATIQKNPDLILKSLRAISAGVDYLRSHPAEAAKELKAQQFSKLDPSFVDEGLQVYAKGWTPGLVTQPTYLENGVKLLNAGGTTGPWSSWTPDQLHKVWTDQFTSQIKAGS